MSEQLRESWKDVHKMAQETLKKMDANAQDWFKEFEKMEERTNGLILQTSKRIGETSEEARKTYKEQLDRANKSLEQVQKNLNERMEAVKRARKHLQEAIDELK